MTANSRPGPAGFTLIELIVVLGIVALVTTIAVAVTLRMQDRDQVPRAATLVQGMLSQAKARAAAERINIGVRFVTRLNGGETGGPTDLSQIGDLDGDGRPGTWSDVWRLANNADNDGNGWVDDLVLCDTLAFVRDPGDFVDGTVEILTLPSNDPLNGRVLQLNRSQPQLNLQPLGRFVQVGDYLELLDLGQTFQITGLAYDPTGPTNRITLDRPVEGPPLPGIQCRYRILRRPQLIAGEKPVQLPTGAQLEIRPGMTLGLPIQARDSRWLEIVFNPQGTVVWPAEASVEGLIALWVRYYRGSPEPDPDLETFVAVYPKTGAVLTFPVDRRSPDPFSFIRTGRSANLE